jgi:hypothetical protein
MTNAMAPAHGFEPGAVLPPLRLLCITSRGAGKGGVEGAGAGERRNEARRGGGGLGDFFTTI